MAVTIKKKKLTLESLVKRLFSAEEGAELLSMAGEIAKYNFVLETSPSQLSLVNDDTVLSSTNVKLSAVNSALKGDLSYVGKKALKAHIKNFVSAANQALATTAKKVKSEYLYNKVIEIYNDLSGNNKVAAIKFYRNETGTSLKEAKDAVEAFIDKYNASIKAATKVTGVVKDIEPTSVGIDPGVELKVVDTSGKPVDLTSAEFLMQPIKGTSDGSVYHLIALSDDIKVAARIKKNNEVALRAIHLTKAGEAGLKAAGLDKKGGGHYSIHLSPPDRPLVSKTVGAILFAMESNWKGIVGNVGALIGVGK